MQGSFTDMAILLETRPPDLKHLFFLLFFLSLEKTSETLPPLHLSHQPKGGLFRGEQWRPKILQEN